MIMASLSMPVDLTSIFTYFVKRHFLKMIVTRRRSIINYDKHIAFQCNNDTMNNLLLMMALSWRNTGHSSDRVFFPKGFISRTQVKHTSFPTLWHRLSSNTGFYSFTKLIHSFSTCIHKGGGELCLCTESTPRWRPSKQQQKDESASISLMPTRYVPRPKRTGNGGLYLNQPAL